jgi:ATP-dependent Clp protease ATP-binding subunit ClpA
MYETWTGTARRVVDAALLDAARRRCAFVEPVHFLVALLQEPDAGAQRWLRDVAHLATDGVPPELEPHLKGIPTEKKWARYSQATEEVLRFVAQHGNGRAGGRSDTLDLLMGILRQERDPANEYLKDRKISLRAVERAIEEGRYRDR